MSTVIYVAVVEGDQDRGYSAFFPDLPGCVTAAETMLELPAAARDALSLHLQGMAEDGDAFPEPTAIEAIKSDPDAKEVGRILVDADVEDAPVRVNISIGAQFLKRVDVAAEARGMTRSGFLVDAARSAMEGRDRGQYMVVSLDEAAAMRELLFGSSADTDASSGVVQVSETRPDLAVCDYLLGTSLGGASYKVPCIPTYSGATYFDPAEYKWSARISEAAGMYGNRSAPPRMAQPSIFYGEGDIPRRR